MKASTDDAPPGRRRDERWDETVLVWNGTVATIPASGVQLDSAEDVADVEGGNATPNRRARGGASSRRPDSNRGPLHYEKTTSEERASSSGASADAAVMPPANNEREAVPDTWSMPSGSLDRWPEDYERGRPGWPPEVVDLPGLPATATVLELGAGTGKLTRLLTPAFARVVAVEPADAMRRLLETICPEAEARAGTAQEIPLEDASVDGVFAAEAFHWFDDERALAEISRVLRPRGALVLMWNVPTEPTEPAIAAVEHFLAERRPKPDEVAYPLDLSVGGPYFASGEWRLVLEKSEFEPFREARLPNPQTIDREGVVAFFASMGWIGDLPDSEMLPLLDEVRSLLTASEYRRQWEADVHWTRRTQKGAPKDHLNAASAQD